MLVHMSLRVITHLKKSSHIEFDCEKKKKKKTEKYMKNVQVVCVLLPKQNTL